MSEPTDGDAQLPVAALESTDELLVALPLNELVAILAGALGFCQKPSQTPMKKGSQGPSAQQQSHPKELASVQRGPRRLSPFAQHQLSPVYCEWSPDEGRDR